MSRPAGTLTVGGVTLAIVGVDLLKGKIQLTAAKQVTETVVLSDGDRVDIRGRDGALIGTLALPLPDGPVVAEGTPDKAVWLHVVQPLGITEFTGRAAWPRVAAEAEG